MKNNVPKFWDWEWEIRKNFFQALGLGMGMKKKRMFPTLFGEELTKE